MLNNDTHLIPEQIYQRNQVFAPYAIAPFFCQLQQQTRADSSKTKGYLCQYAASRSKVGFANLAGRCGYMVKDTENSAES